MLNEQTWYHFRWNAPRTLFAMFMRYQIHVQFLSLMSWITSGQKTPFIIPYFHRLRSILNTVLAIIIGNNWFFFILQKVSNDYAKILLSRHVAHWVRSCLLNEAYITHMFACLLPESPEDDSLPQLLGHVWTAWRILIFHIVHTLSITFKKRYCAHG